MNQKLTIMPKKISLLLASIAVFFITMDLASRAMLYYTTETRLKWIIVNMFSVGKENTIPTWYSVSLLLLASLVLLLITWSKKNAGDQYTYYWLGLGLIFLGLSMDEAASLHEALGTELSARFSLPGGYFYYAWVIPGIIFVLIVGLIYLRFLIHLPVPTRYQFIAAGAIFVLGAIGLEMVAAPCQDQCEGMGFALLVATEEFFEMSGVILFLYTLLAYMGHSVNPIELNFAEEAQPVLSGQKQATPSKLN